MVIAMVERMEIIPMMEIQKKTVQKITMKISDAVVEQLFLWFFFDFFS